MNMKEALASVAKKRKEKGTVRGEITAGDGMFGKIAEFMKEASIEKTLPGTLDKKVKPGFVPVGLDASLFTLSADKLKPEQIIRRNVLDNAAPKLKNAIASQDIFAYNSVLGNLRTMIGRTKGGPKVAEQMPDRVEQQRLSRIRSARRPAGSRASTLGLRY